MNKKTEKRVYLTEKNVKLLKEAMAILIANHLSDDIETQARDMLISILYKRGATITEIAEVVKLNKSTVSRIIKGRKKVLAEAKFEELSDDW